MKLGNFYKILIYFLLLKKCTEQFFRFFERKWEFWSFFQNIIEFVTKNYVTSVLKNGRNSHFSGHSWVNNRPTGQREPVGKEPNSIDICHKLNLGRLFY